jgi:3',5'-cyclic AMP phosphodiesterase CpdA
MPKPFLILHLSDAHIGNPKYALDSFNVFESLFDDLRRMRTRLDRAPDLIVFNGDLAYGEIHQSTLANQYEQAEK